MSAPGPRLLTADAAAAYFSMPVKAFERLRVGRVVFGSRVLYDREALNAHLDALSGLAPKSAPTAHNDDPEAALDRFTARFGRAAGRS
jgi:hypothetical protein